MGKGELNVGCVAREIIGGDVFYAGDVIAAYGEAIGRLVWVHAKKMRSKERERGELLIPDMMRLRAVMLSVQNWTMGQRDGMDGKSGWARMPMY